MTIRCRYEISYRLPFLVTIQKTTADTRENVSCRTFVNKQRLGAPGYQQQQSNVLHLCHFYSSVTVLPSLITVHPSLLVSVNYRLQNALSYPVICIRKLFSGPVLQLYLTQLPALLQVSPTL
jgi:hypothetical protein